MMFRALLLAAAFLTTQALAADLGSAPHPDPKKVLRYVFAVAETGFDPPQVHDLYSNTVLDAICEPLLTYDYLARPIKLTGRTAEAAPPAEEHGQIYTLHVKKGIYFADDPAFKGQRRELTAQDYAYAIRRLMDPKVKSGWKYLVDGKIVGLNAVADAAKTGRFDYDAPVAGLAIPDRYTLKITLTAPDYNFPYILAMPATSGVAREVVEHYGAEIMAHPVGTGPYRLAKWARSSRIELEASPTYRGHSWDQYTPYEPGDAEMIAQMKGKILPTIGRIEIAIIEEDQARLLAFQNKELDLFSLEGPLAPRVLDGAKLKPEFVALGAKLSRIVDPEITNHYFNLRDPVLGGLTKDKIALRRALAMAYDPQEDIRIIRNGQAVELQYPVPPGVVGHLPDYRSRNQTNIPLANALLDRFGYKIGADGWRTLPDGKPLAIRYTSRPDSLGRQQEELWKKSFDKLKIHMESDKRKFPEILKAEATCQIQMRTHAWIADYPDGENFMSLFYGKNIGQSNHACADIPEYNALYEKAARLPPSPERDALWVDMARLLEYYGVHRMNVARVRNMVMQKHVIGYKKHPILHSEWLYADIDTELKGK